MHLILIMCFVYQAVKLSVLRQDSVVVFFIIDACLLEEKWMFCIWYCHCYLHLCYFPVFYDFNISFEKVLRLFWLAEIWDRLAVKVWFNLNIIHLVFTESVSIFGDYSGLSCNRKANDILCSVTVMPYGNTEVRCRMGM